MNSYMEQLATVLYGVWRKRWHGLLVMWLVCVIGWIIVALIPDRYESSARIYVDVNSVLGEVMGSRNMGERQMRQVAAMRRTLISRPNLEKVVRRVDLDLTVETDAEMEKLITDMAQDISIASEGEDLFWLSYQSGSTKFSDQENAELARRVVQNLIAIFFDSDTVRDRDEIKGVQRFLDEQIADYERKLQQAERRKAEFERENLGLLPGESNFMERVQRSRNTLSNTEDQLNELTYARAELQRQLQIIPPFLTTTGTISGVMIGTPQSQQLQILEGQLQQNFARGWLPTHPDNLGLQTQIDRLTAEIRAQPAQGSGSSQVGQGTPNPVYNEIRLQLVQTDQQLASLNARRSKLQRQIDKLQSDAQDAPLIEAEMSKLNRDYSGLRQKYDQLISSREEGRIIQEMDNNADKVKFRIVDPPEVPLTPVEPDRQLLLTMVLAAGLAAGVGSAFLFSQMRSSFATMDQLRTTFNMPVLGNVSTVLSDQQRSQRKLEVWAFGVLFFALFLTYGAVMVWELTQALGGSTTVA